MAPGRYLGIADVDYRHSGGSEYQFLGFISGAIDFAGYGDQDLLKDLEIEIEPDGVMLRLPRKASRADFGRLLPLIRDSGTIAA